VIWTCGILRNLTQLFGLIDVDLGPYPALLNNLSPPAYHLLTLCLFLSLLPDYSLLTPAFELLTIAYLLLLT